MKVIYEFCPYEDSDALDMHRQCSDLETGLNDFSNWLRSEWKYNDKLTPEESVYLEKIRDKFYECLSGAGYSRSI